MLNFCTLFDSNYLTRGLAMYNSLQKCCDSFHLYIFAFDDLTLEILNKLKLAHVSTISLKEFESDELLKLKPGRTKAEYCWTCTPSTILFVIEQFKLDNCTYIDSDLYFYSNPKILFDEMGNNSVMITEHRYPKTYDRAKKAGIYCVQFITFKNDDNGLKVLNWWRNACNNWCYNRYEDGKFGDQKYLDDWCTRFEGIHVLQYLGGGLAPWNIQQYDLLENTKDKLSFKTKKGNCNFDAVFYHYHYVRFYQKGLIDLGWFVIPQKIVKTIYVQYFVELDKAYELVKTIDTGFKMNTVSFKFTKHIGIKEKMKFLFKIVFRYNLYTRKKLD